MILFHSFEESLVFMLVRRRGVWHLEEGRLVEGELLREDAMVVCHDIQWFFV